MSARNVNQNKFRLLLRCNNTRVEQSESLAYSGSNAKVVIRLRASLCKAAGVEAKASAQYSQGCEDCRNDNQCNLPAVGDGVVSLE